MFQMVLFPSTFLAFYEQFLTILFSYSCCRITNEWFNGVVNNQLDLH